MIYRIWIFHYILVRGVYKKRRELTNTSSYALAIFCALSPIFLIITLTVNRDVFWSVFGKDIPFGPAFKLLAVMVVLIFGLTSPKGLKANRIRQIRKAIFFFGKSNRSLSIAYVAFFVATFILSMILPTISK